VFFSEISTVDGKHDVLDFWGVDEVFVFEKRDELFLGGGGDIVCEIFEGKRGFGGFAGVGSVEGGDWGETLHCVWLLDYCVWLLDCCVGNVNCWIWIMNCWIIVFGCWIVVLGM